MTSSNGTSETRSGDGLILAGILFPKSRENFCFYTPHWEKNQYSVFMEKEMIAKIIFCFRLDSLGKSKTWKWY